MATQITITRTISTLPSGHVLAEYTACKGAHEGQQRIGLVSPSGRPVKSAPAVASPAPASKPARKKSAPKRVKKTASKRASKASKASKPLTFNVMSEVYNSVLDSHDALADPRPEAAQHRDAERAVAQAEADFIAMDDTFGDGGAPGPVLVERTPSVPTPSPTPRKGERFATFASRIGMNFADAGPVWRAHKQAREDARARAESARFVAAMPRNRKAVAVEQTAKPAPARKLGGDKPAKRFVEVCVSAPVVPAATRDLDARIAARKTRKLDERSLHSEASSLSDRMARIEAAILALASK